MDYHCGGLFRTCFKKGKLKMLYALLFWEFFKIGLVALGGGMVTVPFLFNLADKYRWFTHRELVDMIAVAESSPGPIGINMATYAGYKTAGITGGLIATCGLVLPSLIVIIIIAGILNKYRQSDKFMEIMHNVHPAVLAMILFAGIELGRLVVVNQTAIIIGIIFWGAIHFVKLHPILYIVAGGITGVLMGL